MPLQGIERIEAKTARPIAILSESLHISEVYQTGQHNRLVIFESSLEGHRARYVEHILRHAVTQPREIVVVLRDNARDSVEYRDALARYEGRVCFDFSIREHANGGLQGSYQRLQALVVALRKWGPAHVIIPSADGLAQLLVFLHAWCWRRSIRESTIDVVVLRLRVGYTADGFREHFVKWVSTVAIAVGRVRTIWSIDDLPVSYLRAAGIFREGKLRYLPDPIDLSPPIGRVNARKSLGLSESATIIGCFGLLDERKGIKELIHASQEIRATPDRILLFAGCARGRAALALAPYAEAQGNIRWSNRYLSSEEFAAYAAAVDVVAACYKDHIGSSSMVLIAAHNGSRVLGSSAGWIGRTIRARRLGWTCELLDREGLRNSLRSAFDAGHIPRVCGSGKWVQAHSTTEFARQLLGMVQSQSNVL